MYSQLRLTALANARVQVELEQIDLAADMDSSKSDWKRKEAAEQVDKNESKINYIDREIETAMANAGPEMSAMVANMTGQSIEEVMRLQQKLEQDEE